MAWTEKLPSGKFRGCWRDSAGRKRHIGPYARKTDAKDAAQEAEVRGRRQAAASAGTLTAKIPWGEWWETATPRRDASDAARIERSIVKVYLLPQWGDVPLNKISRPMVKQWVSTLTPGKSPAYVRRIYAVFAASMARAVDAGVLTASPCVRINNLPKIPKRAKAHVTEKGLAALLATDENGKPKYLPVPAHRVLVAVALETGLRPGELCGLHVDKVDLDGGWITVSEVLIHIDRSVAVRGYPKDKDARLVPLTAKAVDILREHLDGRALADRCGLPHIGSRCRSDLVFRNQRRGCIQPQTLTVALWRAAKAAGMSGATAYAFRRGFATRAAEGGLDPFALKEIMGHATMDQTNEYVQQTSTTRARLCAALGDQPGLRMVHGARGAGHGADPDLQTPSDTVTGSGENAG